MSDYRVDIKIRNNNFLRKLEECGYKTVGEFCRKNGKKSWMSQIGNFINLKRSPLKSNGQYLKIIVDICEILLCSPDDLFTETQLTTCIESNSRTMKINEAEMRFMLESQEQPLQLEDQISLDRLPAKISEMLKTLTPREAKVISLRFGINTDKQTLEEVADRFSVTRERIRQIEDKALRKLRHPTRHAHVLEYLD